jgi:hypothetical protein
VMIEFNEAKATQAVARYLTLAGGKLNYMILIKLLYLMDRKALLSWGRSVTFAECYSMKLGPVLSEVLDLVTEQQRQRGPWQTSISAPTNYTVALQSDPGDDLLSEAEEDIIDEVFAEYGRFTDPFELADLLHRTLPEWTEVFSGRVDLPYRDIWEKGGQLPSEVVDELERSFNSLSRDFQALGVR